MTVRQDYAVDRFLKRLRRTDLLGDRRVVFVVSLLIGGIVWQVLGTFVIDPEVISTPRIVAIESYDLLVSGVLVEHMGLTLRRTLLAMLVTTTVGSVVGLLAGWNEFWRHMLQDYIIVGLAMPSLLAAVFAAMWFGTSDLTPTVAGTLLGFPFLAQNVKNAVENLDAELVDMSKAFDVSRDRYVRRTVVMSVLPAWFSGMRNAFTVTWKIVTVAEFVGIPNGVGFKIAESFQLFSMEGVLAWTLTFSVVIIAIEFAVFESVERRVFDWRSGGKIGLGAGGG
ncbi:MAG: ABC transporter permease subunit [Halobacteriales archaeon]|nr:ABC transporter permease subunit [Halobacteriales archaeon]